MRAGQGGNRQAQLGLRQGFPTKLGEVDRSSRRREGIDSQPRSARPAPELSKGSEIQGLQAQKGF